MRLDRYPILTAAVVFAPILALPNIAPSHRRNRASLHSPAHSASSV
jgi:hypothetical protein